MPPNRCTSSGLSDEPEAHELSAFINAADAIRERFGCLLCIVHLPFLPAEWHGKEVLIFAACYSGGIKAGETAVAPLRALGTPIADVIGPHPFTTWQTMFDPLLNAGARNYWKSHDLDDLSDAAIEVIVDGVRTLPTSECEIFIAHVGGAMARVASDATAWPNRGAHFIMNVHTRWRESEKDAACIARTRKLFDAVTPFASGSA